MRGKCSVALALPVFILMCPAASGDEGSDARSIRAHRVAAPPKIDGRLDDACWRRAEPVTGFLTINSDRPAVYQSIGFVCFDDTHLYVAMECLMPKGAKPVGKSRPHDGNVFSDEVVEIMIDPGRTQADYYQLAVNAHGSTFDCARLYGGSQEDDSWDGQWTAATHVGEDRWSVELALPYYSLGIRPDIGRTWGINLCREAKQPAEYSSTGQRGAFAGSGARRGWSNSRKACSHASCRKPDCSIKYRVSKWPASGS